MCECGCMYVCVLLLLLALPPSNFAIPLPPLFLHLAAHLLHFLQLKSKLSSIRSICRLGRESAPALPSPSLLFPLSLKPHKNLFGHLQAWLHTHKHTYIHTSYATICCFCHFQFEIAAAAAPLTRPHPLFFHLVETTSN